MLRSAIAIGVVAMSGATTAPIVSATWLSQHLDDRDLVIVQTGPKAEYDKAHIAGARFAEDGLESDAMSSGAAMDMSVLPSGGSVRAKLEGLGVSDGSHVVVVYVGNGVPSATRAIYLAHYAGFDNVSLLDGGMAAWQRAGLPVSHAVGAIAPGRITAIAARDGGVDRVWVQAHLNSPHVRIIDARDPKYFDGPPAKGMEMAAGHIPGAHSLPHWSLFTDAGLLLSPAEITAKFRAAGIQPGDTVVAYCHVGVQATAVVFAARVIGQPVTMYIGSFHDWSDHHLPTEGGTP